MHACAHTSDVFRGALVPIWPKMYARTHGRAYIGVLSILNFFYNRAPHPVMLLGTPGKRKAKWRRTLLMQNIIYVRERLQ